jgi:gliding motility-associated-like protein
MKKYFALLIITSIGLSTPILARHLKGGWISYEYISTDNVAKTNKYKITIRQYMDYNSSGGQLDPVVHLGIFDGATNNSYKNIDASLTSTELLTKVDFNPCITNPPDVRYRIDTYTIEVDLPFNVSGYKLGVQRCCRIDGIVNIKPPSNNFGVTYYNKIPGTINGIDYSRNSSPVFVQRDTVAICKNAFFTFDFAASDVDADSLVYVFCDGLHGGYNSTDPNDTQGAVPNPPKNPPYSTITYEIPYDGASPLGSNVTIDPKTGLISGIAPNTEGDYVLSVCAFEYKNGVFIGSTKKEIHITVADCQYVQVNLKPSYISCDGFRFYFKNETEIDTLTSTFLWNFGDPNSGVLDTSTFAVPPPHDYTDTGTYILRLSVKNNFGCSGSDSAIVKTYPGFAAKFKVAGYCFQNAFNFTNTTFAKYGFTDSVHWNFGDITTLADTATLFNPSYKYLTPGKRLVTLYAHSNKGCDDVFQDSITVLDKPTLKLAFRDTLICSIDTLPLQSTSNAPKYLWSPNKWISDIHIANPYVFPKDTTKYIITVNDNGCTNKDSIQVNVLNFIKVDAGPNANICLTDLYQMQTNSYALSYIWSPALTLDDSTKKYPLVLPTERATTYYVSANLGKCQDKDSVTIFTSPYPTIKLSADTAICFGESVQIFGSNYSGDYFSWSPKNGISDTSSISPFVTPKETTDYILTSRFLTGCLKPWKDTVNVHVVQPFKVFAGRDTTVVFIQPLQLNAQVKTNIDKQFVWTSIPTNLRTYLNDTISQSPIATLPLNIDTAYFIVKAYTKEDCYAKDTIKILVFKTAPEIFVPSAFTPNGDGWNDIIRPITVGIKQLVYFNIFNRWGRLLYTTKEMEKGWDGKLNGIPQDTGTFVYTVQGIDYQNKVITKKGTVVLIR